MMVLPSSMEVHWWVYNWMGYQQVGPGWKEWVLGVCPWYYIFFLVPPILSRPVLSCPVFSSPLFPSSAFTLLPPSFPCCHAEKLPCWASPQPLVLWCSALPQTNDNETTNPGLKSLNLWSKINSSSSKLLLLFLYLELNSGPHAFKVGVVLLSCILGPFEHFCMVFNVSVTVSLTIRIGL